MLVMTSEAGNPGDDVLIILPDGRVVEVRAVEVRGPKKCRLGYTAPADVLIYRRSIYDNIQAERAARPVPAAAAE